MGCCVCIQTHIKEPVQEEVGDARNKGAKGAVRGPGRHCEGMATEADLRSEEG